MPADDNGKLLDAIRLLAERPELLHAMLEAAKTAKPKEPEPTVGELWAEFAPWGKRTIKSWITHETSYNTIARTSLKLEGFEGALPTLPWNRCDALACDVYRAARESTPNRRGGTISPTTVNSELTRLRSCFAYHVRITKRIPRDPMVGWGHVDESPFARRGVLSAEQFDRFTATAHPLFQDMSTMSYRCVGLRRGEVLALRKEWIDWDAHVLKLPAKNTKANEFRAVPFPDDVEVILKRHCGLSRGEFVFVNPRDPKRMAPIPATTFQNWLADARKKSGMHKIQGESLVFHHNRHSAVTRLVDERYPESVIRAAAGMSDKTFMRYRHSTPEQWAQLRAHQNRVGPPPISIVAPAAEERRPPRTAENFRRPADRRSK